MSPSTKVLLAVTGLVAGGLLATVVVNKSTGTRVANRLRTAGMGMASVGQSGGTADWWLDRSNRRRQKHLKMLTAKG